jgi:hypothetical protein
VCPRPVVARRGSGLELAEWLKSVDHDLDRLRVTTIERVEYTFAFADGRILKKSNPWINYL